MKRFATMTIAICLVFTLLCGCVGGDVTQDPSQPTSTETTTADPTITDEPTTEPTPLPTDEAGKNLIEGFESGTPEESITSLDWSGLDYGISNPELSIAQSGGDLGKALKVGLMDGSAWCQSFTLSGNKTTDALSGFAATSTYLRIWVNNQTEGTLAIGVVVSDASNTSYLDVASAKAYGANGKEVTVTYNDASGMGGGMNSSIVLSPGFEGWITFPLTEFGSNWSGALVKDISKCEKIKFDIRPSGFIPEEGYYVLDEIALTTDRYGATRSWTDPSGGSSELSKKEQIEEGMNNAKATTPKVTEITAYNPTGAYSGIKAITYDGMNKNGKKTKVFTYVGYPANASASNKVPAIVLLHGGGGHAFLQWVKMWNDRGYAAIAMDNTGYFPTKVNAGSTEVNQDWNYGLPKEFREDGYTAAPNNDGMYSSDGKVDAMWMYHAVGQSILAANVLRADSRVDGDKVGITGISWGSVIASIVIGHDNRFAYAIPVYGSGYSDESLGRQKDNFSGASTQELWSAQDRFDKATMPVLWLCWNDDAPFSINSNSKSYLDTIKNNDNTRLSMINNMYHSHSCGWNPGESMAFADSVVKGGAKLTGFKTQPSGKKLDCELTVDTSATKVKATLYYITAKMTYSNHEKYGSTATYMDQVWKTKDITVSGNKVSGSLPSDAKGYYIEVKTTIGGKDYVTCSVYLEP